MRYSSSVRIGMSAISGIRLWSHSSVKRAAQNQEGDKDIQEIYIQDGVQTERVRMEFSLTHLSKNTKEMIIDYC